MPKGPLNKFIRKRLVYLAVCIAFVPATAAGLSIRAGTYAAFYYSPDFVAVAIDSRETDQSQEVLSDAICKIWPLAPNAFFFAQGFEEIDTPGLPLFHIAQAARLAFAETPPPRSPRQVAARWREIVAAALQRLDAADPGAFQQMLNYSRVPPGTEAQILQGVFVGHEHNGDISAARARFLLRRHAERILLTHDTELATEGTYGLGMTAVTNEFTSKKTERAKHAHAVLDAMPIQGEAYWARYIGLLVDFVKKHGGARNIGGETAIVTIKKRHPFRWVRRPIFCPEEADRGN